MSFFAKVVVTLSASRLVYRLSLSDYLYITGIWLWRCVTPVITLVGSAETLQAIVVKAGIHRLSCAV